MVEKIVPWKDIDEKFNDGESNSAILLGNGASISVDNRFDYDSLKQYAIDKGLLTSDVQSIFDFFDTNDFELILRIVQQANDVNKALKIDDNKTRSSYINVKYSLISAVRYIHPKYGEVVDKIKLIYRFIKKFNRIISLNYDLLTYWAVMYGNGVDDKHALKDCFLSSEFDDDWQKFQNPIGSQKKCSLVFYPHGNLVLARDEIGNERKISANGEDLLESILKKWENGSYAPLFVSEGTSEQKLKSIQNSYYLNTIYRRVLPDLSDNLTIYGWGFDEHDMHILEKISPPRIKRVAISVYKNDQDFCLRARYTLGKHLKGKYEITFFDSESEGCWIHA